MTFEEAYAKHKEDIIKGGASDEAILTANRIFIAGAMSALTSVEEIDIGLTAIQCLDAAAETIKGVYLKKTMNKYHHERNDGVLTHE